MYTQTHTHYIHVPVVLICMLIAYYLGLAASDFPFHLATFRLRHMKIITHQYSLCEHLIVLWSELRSAEHKPSHEVHCWLSHQGGVVHEPVLNCSLHVRLQGQEEDWSWMPTYTLHVDVCNQWSTTPSSSRRGTVSCVWMYAQLVKIVAIATHSF